MANPMLRMASPDGRLRTSVFRRRFDLASERTANFLRRGRNPSRPMRARREMDRATRCSSWRLDCWGWAMTNSSGATRRKRAGDCAGQRGLAQAHFALLAVAAVVAGIVAWQQRGEALRRKAEALRQKGVAEQQRKLAEQQRAVAEQQTKLAQDKTQETLRALSRADFEYGSELIERGSPTEGAAYLARALRHDAANVPAAQRLYSLLVDRSHPATFDAAIAGARWRGGMGLLAQRRDAALALDQGRHLPFRYGHRHPARSPPQLGAELCAEHSLSKR